MGARSQSKIRRADLARVSVPVGAVGTTAMLSTRSMISLPRKFSTPDQVLACRVCARACVRVAISACVRACVRASRCTSSRRKGGRCLLTLAFARSLSLRSPAPLLPPSLPPSLPLTPSLSRARSLSDLSMDTPDSCGVNPYNGTHTCAGGSSANMSADGFLSDRHKVETGW
jgi:hypothetical protein